MRAELQAILTRALAAMCDEVDPDTGLLRKLQTEGVLSDGQIESCKAKTIRADRVDEMVRYLKLRDDSVYEKFRKILCQADYQKLVQKYLPPAEEDPVFNPQDQTDAATGVRSQSQSQTQRMTPQLPGSLTEAFKGKGRALKERLITSGLLDELKDVGLIIGADISSINNILKAPEEKIDELMATLERRSNSKVHEFFTALHNTHQDGVLEDVFKFKWQPNGGFVAMDVVESKDSTTDAALDTRDQRQGYAYTASASNIPETKPSKLLNKETSDAADDDVDIADVKVLHTTEEFYQDHYESAYHFYRKLRGTACIINIFKTFGMTDRRGTDTDRDRLAKLFDQLHFNVKVYNDCDVLTAEEILRKIELSSKEKVDGKKPQCYVLFILSHGGKQEIGGHETEVVYGTDGKPLSKKTIMSVLSDASCSNLQRVPRLIFFQSCRGDVIGLKDEFDAPHQKVQGDFLVCYPCLEDFVSYRNPVHGSRYVRCLVDVFMNNAHNKDVLELLTMLHKKLEALVVADKGHQVPELTSSLRNKLFFFPGYIE